MFARDLIIRGLLRIENQEKENQELRKGRKKRGYKLVKKSEKSANPSILFLIS